MPKYRATLAQNLRGYRHLDFEASDDDAAKRYLVQNWETNIDWEGLCTDCNDFPVTDVEDAILMLDRFTGEERYTKEVDDEITLASQRPYAWDAVQFVKDMANFTTYTIDTSDDQLEDCIVTMNKMIERAKKMLKSD